jgi:hypothetical protein
MARRFQSPVTALSALALLLSIGLGGCASGGMLDQLPAAMGGEPASLPARPKADYKFPAVHDMPPTRTAAPLSDTEQVRLEKELQTARDKQEALAAEPPLTVEPAPAAQKKPAAPKSGQSTGAKTNP